MYFEQIPSPRGDLNYVSLTVLTHTSFGNFLTEQLNRLYEHKLNASNILSNQHVMASTLATFILFFSHRQLGRTVQYKLNRSSNL